MGKYLKSAIPAGEKYAIVMIVPNKRRGRKAKEIPTEDLFGMSIRQLVQKYNCTASTITRHRRFHKASR